LRNQKKMTQEQLAAKIQIAGWDIARDTLAKIEARTRPVQEFRVFYFAHALKVSILEIYPSLDPRSPQMRKTLEAFMNTRH
jgi:transcriptional regulator with XRE-family HTH domain